MPGPTIRPATRQRVLAATDRLGYRPSALARSLRLQRTLTPRDAGPGHHEPVLLVDHQGRRGRGPPARLQPHPVQLGGRAATRGDLPSRAPRSPGRRPAHRVLADGGRHDRRAAPGRASRSSSSTGRPRAPRTSRSWSTTTRRPSRWSPISPPSATAGSATSPGPRTRRRAWIGARATGPGSSRYGLADEPELVVEASAFSEEAGHRALGIDAGRARPADGRVRAPTTLSPSACSSDSARSALASRATSRSSASTTSRWPACSSPRSRRCAYPSWRWGSPRADLLIDRLEGRPIGEVRHDPADRARRPRVLGRAGRTVRQSPMTTGVQP